MAPAIAVTHFTDPGCPWAYSAWPAIATLQWRYGDQLDWKLVTIGLAETPERYEKIGYTPTMQAQGYARYRRFGMPFAVTPRERMTATGRACRAIVATRLHAPGLEIAAFRALQFGHFCSARLFDTDAGISVALESVPGLDAPRIIAAIDDEATEAAYQADRALTRTAAGSPTEFQDRSADTDGAVRYTAPSLIFTRLADGHTLESGGFQPVEAYDVCIANLDTSLQRRPPAEDPADALEAFPHGLTTAEVAAIMAPHLVAPDKRRTELALIELEGSDGATRRPLGDDALWLA